MGAMGVSVFGMMMMMMMMMIVGAAAQAPAPSVDCQTAVLTLADCLSFVTGVDKAPSAACCSELSSIVGSSPECLCLLFNTTFIDPLGINITLAQQLPPLCKVQTPPTSLCSLRGVPVPGPLSSGGMAPTPTKLPPAPVKAPTPTTALGAPVPGPVSTSIAPTLAIAPSSTPRNSNQPTPASNGAPSIMSTNAAIVVSLLLLASVFLS